MCASLDAWTEECPPDNGGYTWAQVTDCQVGLLASQDLPSGTLSGVWLILHHGSLHSGGLSHCGHRWGCSFDSGGVEQVSWMLKS